MLDKQWREILSYVWQLRFTCAITPHRRSLNTFAIAFGGQGNALTGQFYVVNQDPALKAVQAKFPNVDIKAIQDDITIFGDPEGIFDETDDGGEVTKLGALSLLIQELKARGLDCNKIKLACGRTTPDARCLRKEAIVAEGAHDN